MPSWLRRCLHALLMWPLPEQPDAAMTDDAGPAAKPVRATRRFVILRVHIGELGHVKTVLLKISCGDASLDQQAQRELGAMVFPVPRVGRKAVAQWHVMRWDVPTASRG